MICDVRRKRRMQALWKCARKAIPVFLAVSLMNCYAHPAFAEENNLKDDIRNVLLGGAHPGDPSKAEQLRSYAQRTGNSMDDIENTLLQFLSLGLKDISIKEDRLGYLLCKRSIWVFRELRCTKAIPSLMKLLKATTDDNMRHAALMARVTIGGKELLPYARDVFCNRKNYCSHGRFLLYEQLSPYVGVNAVRPAPLEEDALPPEHETLRPLVLEFMRNAVYDDITTAGNTKRLDGILCIADKDYKISHEREDVLKRLEDAWSKIESGQGSPSARAYSTEQLKVLRAIPMYERTHIEINTIETKEVVEQSTGE